MTVKKVIGASLNKMENFELTNSGFEKGDVYCQWFHGTKIEDDYGL